MISAAATVARRLFPLTAISLVVACQRDLVSPDVMHKESTTADSERFANEARLAKADTTLWRSLEESDGIMVVAFKSPSSQKAMVRGRPTIDASTWVQATREVAMDKDVRVVSVDTVRFPIIRVRPSSLDAIKRLRSLPYIDFVEPNVFKVTLFSGDGCTSGSSGGDSQYTDPTVTLASGD